MFLRRYFANLVLIALISSIPTLAQTPISAPESGTTVRHYVGSTGCKTCHPQIYARWKKTRMANVVVDPKEHPDVIAPDLSKPDPLVTFRREDIAFVYGSKWKQRYFKKV